MWTLLWANILLSTCSASNQTRCCGCDQEEAVPGVYTEQYLRFKLDQVDLTDLSWSPSQSASSDRERRDHDQTQSLTITVEDHLAKGLKEVIDQYLKEMQNKHSAKPLTSHLDYYHYDEEFLGSENLFSHFASSGTTRINTPFQCLWKRCSLGLFSTSGQGVTTWGIELMVFMVAINVYRQFKGY
jgi:hypothetical protein